MKTTYFSHSNHVDSLYLKIIVVFFLQLISIYVSANQLVRNNIEFEIYQKYSLISSMPLRQGDTTFGVFTEVTPSDTIFITPFEKDFWVNATAPADYDNDGDLDIALIGLYVTYNVGGEYILILMRNDGAAGTNSWNFTPINLAMGSLTSGSSDMAWGDADGDGDLDLLVGSNNQTILYLNQNGALTPSSTELPGYWEDNSQAEFDLRSLSWVDFDNDGDQDILIPSVYDQNSLMFRTALLRNDGKDNNGNLIFMETSTMIDPTNHAQSTWADYDSDGDLDLLIVNIAPIYNNSYIRLYKNEGNGILVPDDILGTLAVVYGEAQWGDYDGDGDLDILIAGGVDEIDGTYTHMAVRIYKNDNGNYTPEEAIIDPIAEGWIDISAATWADYDSDGDMDILVAGNYNSGTNIEGRARIYSNASGTYTDSGTELPAPRANGDLGGNFSWLDLDSDGDLDYFISGQYFVPGGNGLVESQMHLYRNDSQLTNLPPSVPIGITQKITENSVKLTWQAATDDHTSAVSITYDFELYKDNSPIVLPERLPQPGNVSAVNTWSIEGLEPGNYTWAIRSVDAAFAGSQPVTGTFDISTVGQPETPSALNSLEQNIPNPAVNHTTIAFTLPENKTITLSIYNSLGQVVAVPIDQSNLSAGMHSININTSYLAEGVYFYKLSGCPETKKLLVKRN